MPNLDDFLSRIQTDHSFYLHFRQNPQEALASYGLSPQERALLTEFREQLWARVGRSSSYWKTNCSDLLLEPGGIEFNALAALDRPEVQNTVREIREATVNGDRLVSVLALVEQIG